MSTTLTCLTNRQIAQARTCYPLHWSCLWCEQISGHSCSTNRILSTGLEAQIAVKCLRAKIWYFWMSHVDSIRDLDPWKTMIDCFLNLAGYLGWARSATECDPYQSMAGWTHLQCPDRPHLTSCKEVSASPAAYQLPQPQQAPSGPTILKWSGQWTHEHLVSLSRQFCSCKYTGSQACSLPFSLH